MKIEVLASSLCKNSTSNPFVKGEEIRKKVEIGDLESNIIHPCLRSKVDISWVKIYEKN